MSVWEVGPDIICSIEDYTRSSVTELLRPAYVSILQQHTYVDFFFFL